MAEEIGPQKDPKEHASEETAQENKDVATKKKGLKGARIEVKVGLLAAIVIVLFGVLFGTHVLCLHQWSDVYMCPVRGDTRQSAWAQDA